MEGSAGAGVGAEGWIGGGDGEDRSSCLGGGTGSSFGISRLEISSPSSARSAIVLPTATFFAPSGAYHQ